MTEYLKRAIGATLGALAGLAFSTMGLIDTSDGLTVISLGGNDVTPAVIAVGVVTGAVLGITVLWRFPLAILGAIVGLAAGMWLRDNLTLGSVQPPWVFLLLFGLPIVGIAGGYLLHLPRTTWARYSTAGAVLAGLAVAVVGYAAALSLWATAIRDPSCDAKPLPGGGVLIPLCPAPSAPVWIIVVAALLGVAVGIFTHGKLNSPEAPDSDETPQTS